MTKLTPPICCYCDNYLSCEKCGHEQPADYPAAIAEEVKKLRVQLEHYEWGRKNTQTEMDEREAEIEKLRSQLVSARAALTDIEEGAECGWVRGRARKALRVLTDDLGK